MPPKCLQHWLRMMKIWPFPSLKPEAAEKCQCHSTYSDVIGWEIPLREWAENGPKIWDNDNVRGTIWRWHTRQRTVAAIPENEDTFSSNHRQFRKWVGWRGKTQKATIASHSILLSCTEQLNGIEKRISHLPGRTDRICKGSSSDKAMSSSS